MEWKTVKISDIAYIINGGTPKTSIPEYWDGDIPWLSVKDFNTGLKYVSSAEKHITEEGLEHSATNLLEPEDIIISARGTIGVIAMLSRPMAFNQSCFGLRARNFDAHYLYYLLKEKVKELQGQSQGSVFDTIVRATFDRIECVIPATMDDQRRIAAILSSLDDKIENNNRINRNLEAQAQALFKSWFIDFEPFGGVLPEDWEETTIGEICKCYLGGTPSRAKAEYWNGEIPWINSGEVNKYRILEGSEYITELGLQKSATKLLPRKTTVLAITGATLGQVSLLEIEACANQSVIGIVQNEKVPYEFIYPLILNDIEQIMLHQTGGAQQHINKDNVESHKLILPTDEVMAKYKAIQAPLFETIANNCFESQRLATLRDTLLPKLMKGEIEL